MRNLGVKILIIAAVFTVFVMLPKIADADGYSLEINPGIIKIKASPPALVKTGIRIKNLSDNPIELGYILKPFVASEKNSGQIKYLLYSDYTSKNFNFLQRIKVLEDNQAISKIILSPKQEKNLTILIDLPQEEEQADHYFSIVFLTQSQEKLDSNYKALIRDFSTSVFVSQGPVKFNLKIENIGKNFITTSGYIIIDNIFGQTVGKIDIKPANILGKSTLEILKDDVVWQEKFLLGIYTAKLYLNYDDSTSLYREFRFITIPIKILAILTIAGFIIIFIKNRSKTH